MGSASFGYTGGWQTFNVPTGVTSLNVSVYGASGYGLYNAGRLIGTLSVADTDTLYINVGGYGKSGATGNYHTQAGGAAPYSNGGAGGAGYNAQGGDSGGAATFIKLNSTAGSIKCVAAGGAGNSGDGGIGGAGGTNTGVSGARGNAGSGSTVAATGGSQSTYGRGGTSSSGSSFDGSDAYNGLLGRAGAGGSTGGLDGPGGGGGGGGYYSGGGGQAGSAGWAPGGGGGGGSSYVGGMSSCSTNDRNGGNGDGLVNITWTDPNQPPATPTITYPSVSGTRTSAVSSVTVSATVSAPPLGSTETRILARYSTSSSFSSYTDVYSGYRTTAGSLSVALTLAHDTHYYLRVYAQGNSGLYSGYDSSDFYTDYTPSVPTSLGPSGATQSMGSVTLTATSTDPDGDTVRQNFQYDNNSAFTSPTSVSSGYVASGSAGTIAISGLLTDTQYWLRSQAQDSPGLTSAYSASVNFWTNRTPTAPTLNQPFSGEVFDTSIAQTFTWTFNDPDPGDTQSAATLQYRQVGTTTWTQVTVTTAQSYTFAANTFTPNVSYEWQVQTTDAGGLTGPFSASSNFSGSPPSIAMLAQGSLTISASDTVPATVAMASSAGMSLVPSLTESPVVPMSAAAGIVITPVKTISLLAPMSAATGMSINSAVTHVPTVALHGTASLFVGGTKSVPAVVNFSASGGIVFQLVNADNIMQAQAGMTVVPLAVTKASTSVMGAVAGIVISQTAIDHPSTSAMSATTGMTVDTTVTTSGVLGMAARASVINSAGLSRIIPMVMSSRAQIFVDADPEHPGSVALSAQTGMVVAGHGQHLGVVGLVASGGMTVVGHGTLDGGLMPMGAAAGMAVTGYRSFTGAITMGASAGIAFTQVQYTFDPPYLIALDSHGDTLTLTRNSSPIPSKVTNKTTVTNTGNVAP